MRSEREPNRYEPLYETHRRVAEEEEKRQQAEQDQAGAASFQSAQELYRPETGSERHRPKTEPEHDADSPEARLAAKEQELREQVQLGRINSSEMIYQLRQFDNELRVEIEQAGLSSLHDSSGGAQPELSPEAALENAPAPQRTDDTRDQTADQSRDNPSQRMPDTTIEREAQTAEYEIVGRGEMTAARAARLERLRSIDRSIEQESHENEAPGLIRGEGAGRSQ